jgi:hypothetical protein
MADETKGEPYFGSDEGRLASTQDEQRLAGESSPPALTDESGTPRFSKGHAPAQHKLSAHRLTEEERRLRGDAKKRYQGSRGTPTSDADA